MRLMRTKTRRRERDEVTPESRESTATEATDAAGEVVEEIDDLVSEAEELADETADCVAENLGDALRANYDASVARQNEILAELERAQDTNDEKVIRDAGRRWDSSFREYVTGRDRTYESFGTTREAELERRGCGCGCDPWV